MNTRYRSVVLSRILLASVLLAGLMHGSIRPAAAAAQIDIPGPAGSGAFGSSVTVLPNGNFVVTDPAFNGGIGVDTGAAYLYNGASGTLLSTLTGSTAGDQVGSGGVTVLSNGNYLVRSPHWHNGAAADAGAVTWGSAVSGVSGAITASNSLVGSHAYDQVGADNVVALTNGNYVVGSPYWDRGAIQDAGAATWGDGASGTKGIILGTNSWVGGTADDSVGTDVLALANGNYVVVSPDWDRGAIADAGAVTWGDGISQTVTGEVRAINSLVGGTADDQVGSYNVTALSNGNYVVQSTQWDNAGAADAGAVTWGDGAAGATKGAVSPSNSLVGNKASDFVGLGYLTELTNGNCVVCSYLWGNTGALGAGAATWMNGAGGVTGNVSSANSLVGDKTDDNVCRGGVTALSNGNYVVKSYFWGNTGAPDAGAATWGNGATGTAGTVTAANSLVGVTTNDQVSINGVTALTNGNYVVGSPYWDNGGTANAGAATWGNGAAGIAGPVITGNSLVGSTADDLVGFHVVPLSNGNYVVRNSFWNNTGAAEAGAATWGNGTIGTVGVVTPANSLVGGTTDDQVGFWGVTALSNGNYVVTSQDWDNAGVVDAGAVTWGDGATGISGLILPANSLVGGQTGDRVGYPVNALADGNYVVNSYQWNNGSVADAGAITWGNGNGGTVGPISAAISLVGSTAGDQVGVYNIIMLENGSYAVTNPYWDNAGTANAGAVTWSFGPRGLVGPITMANSVLGTAAGGGAQMKREYDPVNDQLVVGRPADNIVTLFRIVHGVMAFPDSSTLSGLPGATVNYSLQVTNTGDTVDSFDLALGAHDWTTTSPATVGPLDPGASQNVTVSVSVPAAAPGGDTDAVTVTIASQADNTKVDSAVLTTTAGNVYGVTVTPATSAGSGLPGATVSYTLAITNTSNTAASFNLAASAHNWTATFPATVGPLNPGASQNVTVSVTVPASALGGSTDVVTITVTSQADNTKKDTAVLTTTASNVYGVTVTPATSAGSGAPGSTVSYTLAITNTSNTAASFTLTASAHNWTATFPSTVGPLNPGAVQSVTVNVTVPASALGGSTDVVTITVTSQADPTKVDTAVLTTTAGERKIYMPVMRK